MKPNVKDFDLQPYGYINALHTYIKDMENKCLDRLRQQYKALNFRTCAIDEKRILLTEYSAMRLFCLDCELVSFNDVEAMEYEVNSSF